jgi:hypothetical protein
MWLLQSWLLIQLREIFNYIYKKIFMNTQRKHCEIYFPCAHDLEWIGGKRSENVCMYVCIHSQDE